MKIYGQIEKDVKRIY